MASTNTAFPIGLYVANPNGNDAAEEKDFEAKYDAFVRDMNGAHPTFFNAFTDFGKDPSEWGSSTSWSAWSANQTGAHYVGSASGATPVVGVPLASNDGGWGNVDQFYQDISAGKYDADYKSVVDGWAQAGYKTVEFRNGYEFDGNWMPWSPGNSSSPTAIADFVQAFQHVADIEHSQGKADGIMAKVIWNPDDINWTGYDVTTAYPGDSHVDIISTDAYSQIYPLDLTDWAHGGTAQLPNVATWAADPVNRAHELQYGNGSQYNQTPGLGSSGWSFQNTIDFAKLHGKPMGVDEAGAGPNGSSAGPADDPGYVKWLHDALSNAQAQGVAVDHVNIWDTTMPDGNWNFSDGTKPLEQAAFGQYFGAGSSTTGSVPDAAVSAPSAASSAPVVPQTVPAATDAPAASDAPAATDTSAATNAPGVPAAPDTTSATGTPPVLTLAVSEDAYQGDAQFTVTVDGEQMGDTMTVTALHGIGQVQSFTFAGIAAGPHDVAVTFTNDAWDGTPDTDRNLYVNTVNFGGKVTDGATFYSEGIQHFTVG